jgi:hypothetical protein
MSARRTQPVTTGSMLCTRTHFTDRDQPPVGGVSTGNEPTTRAVSSGSAYTGATCDVTTNQLADNANIHCVDFAGCAGTTAAHGQEPLWSRTYLGLLTRIRSRRQHSTVEDHPMITRMSNGWYMFDEHEVPRIIDALLVADYKRLPHWFFVHGHNHITLQYSRRGMSILAPPDIWGLSKNPPKRCS